MSEGFLVYYVFYKRGFFFFFDRILLELNGFLNENNIIKGLRLILMIIIKFIGLIFSIEIILMDIEEFMLFMKDLLSLKILFVCFLNCFYVFVGKIL